MAKFRKKPVVIEAEQFTGQDVPHCVRKVIGDVPVLEIQTLEGTMLAMPGDWIITGIKGERYPCKPDIFAATYEEVPADGV